MLAVNTGTVSKIEAEYSGYGGHKAYIGAKVYVTLELDYSSKNEYESEPSNKTHSTTVSFLVLNGQELPNVNDKISYVASSMVDEGPEEVDEDGPDAPDNN